MEVTKDPFHVLSSETMERVMQHLTVKEILQVSEVSKSWCDKTAQSESFLRRLKVVVKCSGGTNKQSCNDNREFTQKKSWVILLSPRKFHTLEVKLCRQCLFIMRNLFLNTKWQEWKHVTISNSQFEVIAWLPIYLVPIQESLETVTLRNITVRQEEHYDIAGSWNFPKLKVLNIENCHSQTLLFCFKNCENLEELHFIDGSLHPDSDPMNALIRVLQRNESLRTLSIGGNVFFSLMERFRGCQLFSTLRFQIQKLIASSFFWPMYTWLYDTFAEFVRSQSDSLVSIEFSRFMGFPALCAAYDCPRLTQLILKGRISINDVSEWRHYVLNENRSIQTLMMCFLPTGFDAGLSQDVLAAAPNAKSLYVSWMNDSLIAHLTTVNPGLENIFIDYLNLSMDTIMNRDTLPKLKTLEILKCSTNIPERIKPRGEMNSTNFQNLFYEFFYKLCSNSNVFSEIVEDSYSNIEKILTLLE